MPLFDFYIMVDRSGAARRRGRRSDCIWIAHGPTEADEPVTDSPFSRTEAIRLIRSVLLKEIASGHRVFVGFDFAYGYPVDFAAALQAATGMSDKELPWPDPEYPIVATSTAQQVAANVANRRRTTCGCSPPCTDQTGTPSLRGLLLPGFQRIGLPPRCWI